MKRKVLGGYNGGGATINILPAFRKEFYTGRLRSAAAPHFIALKLTI